MDVILPRNGGFRASHGLNLGTLGSSMIGIRDGFCSPFGNECGAREPIARVVGEPAEVDRDGPIRVPATGATPDGHPAGLPFGAIGPDRRELVFAIDTGLDVSSRDRASVLTSQFPVPDECLRPGGALAHGGRDRHGEAGPSPARRSTLAGGRPS